METSLQIKGLISYEEYGNNSEYLNKILNPKHGGLFPPKIIASGMIDWKDENDAAGWGGPWDNRYVACRIMDHSLSPPLPTVKMVNAEESAYHKYSMHNVDRPTLKKVFGNEPNFKDWYFEQVGSDGSVCSRSELTGEELDALRDKGGYDAWWDRLMNMQKNNKQCWWKERPTKEYPIVVKLFGNDDCSYTRVFKTVEDAVTVVSSIIESPKMERIQKTFTFTN